MEAGQIGIILSILSAVWTVWTWTEQEREEKNNKKAQIAALYVNPFLLAAEELQDRLYRILNSEELEFLGEEEGATEGLPSEEALEILYILVKYFGWSGCIYRYGPYTKDKRLVELSRAIVETFANRKDFGEDCFHFTVSEQRALGQTFVKPLGRKDSVFPEFESTTLYEFEEELKDEKNKESPLYQNVRRTLDSLSKVRSVDELPGKERLELVRCYLVDLLNYLEDKEGFSVSPLPRKKAKVKGNAVFPHESKDSKVIHQTRGRIRLRIPRLYRDSYYGEELRSLLESIVGVQTVSINIDARSIVVTYNPSIPEAEFQQRVESAITQLT
jgi:hypothetical protein